MIWTTPAAHEREVTSREFRVQLGRRPVAARIFFTEEPRGMVKRPVVLVQHGGSSHKGGQDVLDLVDVFVGRHRMVVVAMDGPVHGSRRDSALTLDDRERIRDQFLLLWREAHDHVQHMVDDWRDLIRVVSTMDGIDATRMAWIGLSMGTAYGLPLLASDPGLCAAVLGMWGLSYPNSQRLAADALSVHCPVLFQQKWDDELFDRQGQLALFDNIAASDKRLCIYPGRHTAVQGQQMRDVERFILDHLAAPA